MKAPLFATLAALVLLWLPPVAQAQNLFNNPGFETGDLTAWTGTNTIVTNANGDHSEGTYGAAMVATGGGGPPSPATLAQTLVTTAGQTYLLTFDFMPVGTGMQTVEVRGTNSLASRTLVSDGSGAFQHAALTFVADTTSATVTLDVIATGITGQLTVDNFFAAEAKYSKPGKYSGNVRVTTAVASRTISSAHLETIVARIDASGQIFMILQPGGTTTEGFITDGKEVIVDGQTATAKVTGNNVKFTLEKTVAAGSPGNPSSQDLTITSSYLLRRVGN